VAVGVLDHGLRRCLGYAVRKVFEHVEAGDPLLGQHGGRVGSGLLENRSQDVADLRFLALGALHVKDRRLQDPAEGHRLFGLAFLAARKLLDRIVQIRVQAAPQEAEVHAAGAQNALGVGVVRQRVEQVLEREIRMPARHGLAERDVKNHFNGSREHQASSMVARNGYPASAASDLTVSAFVSATSHGYTPAMPRPLRCTCIMIW